LSTRRPRIGITTYPRAGEDRPVFSLPTAYVDRVRAAGGLPLLMAPGHEEPEEYLEHVEGVIFAGGGDLHPDHFAGEEHPAQYGQDDERDAFELRLMRAALQRETPTFAICRGLQLLNVVRGGDLHVHLPDVKGDAVPHRDATDKPILHAIRLAERSLLASVYGVAQISALSWHHQAVNRLGRGLVATAWAEDGTIEGLGLEGADWLLAVQWHPELREEELLIFRAFVETCRQKMRSHGI
jgi:putative glutamine amidotransferase